MDNFGEIFNLLDGDLSISKLVSLISKNTDKNVSIRDSLLMLVFLVLLLLGSIFQIVVKGVKLLLKKDTYSEISDIVVSYLSSGNLVRFTVPQKELKSGEQHIVNVNYDRFGSLFPPNLDNLSIVESDIKTLSQRDGTNVEITFINNSGDTATTPKYVWFINSPNKRYSKKNSVKI